MRKLIFTQPTADNTNICKEFEYLMSLYSKELDEHQNQTTPSEIISKWTNSILRMQNDPQRYLELCYDGNTLIGFLYGKIDLPEHKGFIKPGYGFIMEFYVLPQYRRNGYGKEMFYRLEKLFDRDGAKQMWLTSDPITGKPFWESLGFTSTGEKSPENGLDIYEKTISAVDNHMK